MGATIPGDAVLVIGIIPPTIFPRDRIMSNPVCPMLSLSLPLASFWMLGPEGAQRADSLSLLHSTPELCPRSLCMLRLRGGGPNANKGVPSRKGERGSRRSSEDRQHSENSLQNRQGAGREYLLQKMREVRKCFVCALCARKALICVRLI